MRTKKKTLIKNDAQMYVSGSKLKTALVEGKAKSKDDWIESKS